MSLRVSTRASATTESNPEHVFDIATNSDRFPEFFRGFGPIPAVTRVTWLTQPPATGGRRAVETADGETIEEDVVALERPHTHRYRIPGGFPAPFSWLVRSAEGHWSFLAHGQTTTLHWDYSFELTHPLSWLITAPLVKICFRLAMQRCLNAMVKAAKA